MTLIRYAVFSLLFIGCSPSYANCSLEAIVGKWEGSLISLPSRRERPMSITVAADGTWENIVPGLFNPGPNFYGATTASDGKCQWKSKTTGRTGTFLLHEFSGTRMLVMLTDDGNLRGELKPVK